MLGRMPIGCISFDSYIKPQPTKGEIYDDGRCISFDSYIKPQRFLHPQHYLSVVYLLIPTSNHNLPSSWFFLSVVVYLLIPTSNHNDLAQLWLYGELYIF